MNTEELKSATLRLSLMWSCGQWCVTASVDGVPLPEWHSGDTPHDALRQAIAGYLPAEDDVPCGPSAP